MADGCGYAVPGRDRGARRPDNDESGKGRWRGDYRYEHRGRGYWDDDRGRGPREYAYRREYKEEFWDGRCKVERKWERNGDYKEERKCKARWD